MQLLAHNRDFAQIPLYREFECLTGQSSVTKG